MLSSAAVPAIPMSLPEWLGNRTDLLPPVDEATRRKVRELREIIRENCPEPRSEPSPAYLTAAKELVRYGETTGQAMVWDYLEEPEALDPVKLGTGDRTASIAVLVLQNGQKKQEILMLLGDDPTLVQWILPLLRVRMAWFEKAISENRIFEVISLAEIAGIEAYLYRHGEYSDLEALHQVIEGLQRGNFERKLFAKYPSLASQAGEIAEERRIHKLHARPYYQRIRLLLRGLGVEVPDPAKSEINGASKDRSRPEAGLSIEKKSGSVEAGPKTQGGEDTSTPWVLWLVVIAAAIGLLCLMLKKQK